jgi:hypothetical protein
METNEGQVFAVPERCWQIMIRIMLVSAISILIIQNSEGQWYYRQYGVKDIFQLTPDQFKDALNKANNGVRAGAVISAVGVAGVVSGVVIASVANHKGIEGESNTYTGVFIAIASAPIALTGFTILLINGSHAARIKEILKNAGISIGLMNYHKEPLFCNYNPCTAGVPAISFVVHF